MREEDPQPGDLVRLVGRKPYQIVAPGGPTVQECFSELIPLRPYCADQLRDGVKIRGRNTALLHPHIQLNGPNDLRWLNFDVDRQDARFAADDANLLQPTFVAVNPSNGHAHLAYLLGRPVLRFADSRGSPLRFAAAVERGFVRRLAADPHYSGLIAKNPMHPDWRVEWLAQVPYDLPTLADWLFERDMRPEPGPESEFGLSRNCQVFDELRAVAYREVLTFKQQGARYAEFAKRLEGIASGINQQFLPPLSVSEIRGIARSVAKWTWRHFSPAQFSKIQASRSRGTRRSTKTLMAIVDALANGRT